MFTAGLLSTVGTEPVSADFSPVPGHSYLIEAQEHGNDVLLEILDPGGHVMARADHPERRSGTQRAIVAAPPSGRLTFRIAGTEHANVSGTASVRAFDLAGLEARADCIEMLQALAAADAAYAEGKEISSGHATSSRLNAHDVFLRALQEYSTAERALTAPGDRALRGETQLALAGVEYQGLQDWAGTVEWAKKAAATLGIEDPYRRARSNALGAAARIEIGSNGTRSAELRQARQELLRLERFHEQRGERYDAALQLTDIALTYLYEGRYPECAAAALSSSRMFGSLHEAQRRAQAWQNRALCLWGLGRLPEALQWFERARSEIGPQPYPKFFVTVSNNTALADYALGRFDESLRLYDQTLGFTQKVQTARGEGDSLYGIGVNYYALGNRERAREFLERSLAIRTVALDGRGRMATLRALATIDAEQGRLEEALARDREALGLAVAPSASARIRIQLAAHTRDAGRLEESKGQLDAVLSATTNIDPLIRAEALLQRAEVLRQMGRYQQATADLSAALPRLHRLGSVAEEFEAELELGRTLRVGARPREALTAVERALALSDALRLQSANPELRSQLQKPLRPAYELKIELLRARYEDASAAGRTREAYELAALAFATADASRAHSLADVAAQEYPPDVRHALAAEFHHREELYRELAARRYALDERLDRSGSGDPRAVHLRSDIADLQRRVDGVNTLIATRTSPKSAPTHASGERSRVPALPADTALVSYWLGEESAFAWVVTPGGIQWARLPPTAQITQKVTAFHRSLARLVDVPVERRRREGREVYELIVRPVEPQLIGVHQWVVVPDGALDYVPFAALRMSDQAVGAFVASQHDVAFTPAAWMLETNAAAQPRHSRALLLVADPVYQADDPRLAALVKGGLSVPPAGDVLSATGTDYRRLPFTAREAAQISAQFAPGEVDELTGLNATRERLLALDWSQYRFIHFATHGLVDAQVPQLSALLVGSYDAQGRVVDGAIRVADLSLQTLTADVAVFSACETALGQEVSSEGLVGIGSTTLARGARAVVASLWPVADEIGAGLMTEFYQHLLRDSMSPPAALGAAMRTVVSRDGSADPAVWAAFQVSVVTLGPGLPVRDSGREAVAKTRP